MFKRMFMILLLMSIALLAAWFAMKYMADPAGTKLFMEDFTGNMTELVREKTADLWQELSAFGEKAAGEINGLINSKLG